MPWTIVAQKALRLSSRSIEFYFWYDFAITRSLFTYVEKGTKWKKGFRLYDVLLKKDFQKCIECLSKKKLVLYCPKLELDHIASISIFEVRRSVKGDPTPSNENESFTITQLNQFALLKYSPSTFILTHLEIVDYKLLSNPFDKTIYHKYILECVIPLISTRLKINRKDVNRHEIKYNRHVCIYSNVWTILYEHRQT